MFSRILICAIALSWASLGCAGGLAAVQQAGNYEGSVSGARYFYETGQKEGLKESVTLSVDTVGNYVLTGVTVSASGVGVFGAVNGALTSSNSDTTVTIPLQFSTNGKVKGTLHIVKSSQYFVDAKVSLKKVLP
jgi:hypothetical protein